VTRFRPSRSFSPLLVGVSACLAALLGCTTPASPTQTTPTVADPGPTVAAPTMQCTPPTGGSATPCTQKEYDANQAKLADYAEAEKVYRQFVQFDNKLARTGALANSEVLALLGGPMVADYTKDMKDQHDAGMTTDGDTVLTYARPSGVTPYQGSSVALDTCLDGSAVNATNGKTPVMKLQIVKGHAYFARVEGSMRLWWTDGEYVTSC